MTWWHHGIENPSHKTGPLWGESAGHQWMWDLVVSLLLARLICWRSRQIVRDARLETPWGSVMIYPGSTKQTQCPVSRAEDKGEGGSRRQVSVVQAKSCVEHMRSENTDPQKPRVPVKGAGVFVAILNTMFNTFRAICLPGNINKYLH